MILGAGCGPRGGIIGMCTLTTAVGRVSSGPGLSALQPAGSIVSFFPSPSKPRHPRLCRQQMPETHREKNVDSLGPRESWHMGSVTSSADFTPAVRCWFARTRRQDGSAQQQPFQGSSWSESIPAGVLRRTDVPLVVKRQGVKYRDRRRSRSPPPFFFALGTLIRCRSPG